MKIFILISENFNKNFIMKSLSFFNFKQENIHTSSVYKYLEELNICYQEEEADKINYNEYDLIICDLTNYKSIKNIYNNKFIICYDDQIKNDILNDYNSYNICLDVNSGIKEHLSHNISFNLDDNKYYYLKDNILFNVDDNHIFDEKDIFYINNKYIENIENIEKTNKNHEITNINTKIVDFEDFPYKIVEYENKYYKKYNNKIQEIDIDTLKKKMNNIIKSIYIDNENISNCELTNNLEIHFTILILSYNNEKYTDLCLKSALNQNYKNFNVLFINCNSTDKTSEICQKYVHEFNNYTIIDENDRVYQTENFLLGTLLSEKNTTIVSLDGDDWFNDSNVLEILNDVYFSTRCLMTHGSYVEFPYRNVRWAWKDRSLEELVNIRKNKFSLSHLRTWNKELFLNIKLDSLKINDEYPKMAGDVSVLLSMVEMCPDKCVFINKTLYVYNRINVLSDANVNEKLQIETAEYFFNKEKHSRKDSKSILQLNDPLLYFINELVIGYLKFLMIEKYLNHKKYLNYENKSKFTCNYSYKILKNTGYETTVHNYFKLNNLKDSREMKVFFNKEKLNNYKYLKNNKLYEKYCKIKEINILGIIILSCKKRLNKAIEKLNKFNKSNINAICKIFIGDMNIEKSYEENNIVYLKVPDNYESLPLKVYSAMVWYITQSNVDYIFKTDDDIDIDFLKLFELFEGEISNKNIYGGNVGVVSPYVDDWHFGKCENMQLNSIPININYYGLYCSGGGYFVHKNILTLCLDRYLEIYYSKNILAEDLLMGIVINEMDILPLHIFLFDRKILEWGEHERVSYYLGSWRNLLSLTYKSVH